jgi:hypothetical protein
MSVKKCNKTILLRGSISSSKNPTAFVEKSIPTIRKWFDGELVVSTWKGQEKYFEGIENLVDKFVLLDDPGSGFIQEFNRQLISYKEGLNQCEGDVVLVARSDFNITDDPFDIWNSVCNLNNDGKMKVFEKRVVVGNMMTIHPERGSPTDSFFRVSDWLQIGQKTDLEKWANVLTMSKKLYDHAISQNMKINDLRSPGTEHFWFISLLRQYLGVDINMLNYQDMPLDMVWAAIINNFSVKNTRSTLHAHNMNWEFQPEFLSEYMTEQEYDEKFLQLYERKTQ